MDREVIERKLESLHHCLQRIEQNRVASKHLVDFAEFAKAVAVNCIQAP